MRDPKNMRAIENWSANYPKEKSPIVRIESTADMFLV
jgi:hypothetical protein